MSKSKYKKYSSNKKPRGARQPVVSRPPEAQPRAPVATKASAAPKATSTTGKAVDFRAEYRYVLGDLKRIGILAAAMFATLVVLALVIR